MQSCQSGVSDSSSATLKGEETFRHGRVDRRRQGGGRDWGRQLATSQGTPRAPGSGKGVRRNLP